MSGLLKWEEFLNSERARVGALEFFVCATKSGAELYSDGGSFDQGYGSTRHASVEEAKASAEETARHTFSALTAHFAPVLQWTHGERESTATLGRWRLSATDGAWSVGVVAFEWVGPVDGSRGPTTRASNCSAAETSLRSLGVTFRTEGGQ